MWLGLGVSLVATALHGAVAVALWRAGRRLRSITLRADAKHLLTDVWTSAGILAGVLLVPLTGWLRLAPLIALVVALNIVWTGLRLLHETGSGLLDAALPPEDRAVVDGSSVLRRIDSTPVACAGRWRRPTREEGICPT